jgi:hypothetical protein
VIGVRVFVQAVQMPFPVNVIVNCFRLSRTSGVGIDDPHFSHLNVVDSIPVLST